jgi:hypothetical protein
MVGQFYYRCTGVSARQELPCGPMAFPDIFMSEK